MASPLRGVGQGVYETLMYNPDPDFWDTEINWAWLEANDRRACHVDPPVRPPARLQAHPIRSSSR